MSRSALLLLALGGFACAREDDDELGLPARRTDGHTGGVIAEEPIEPLPVNDDRLETDGPLPDVTPGRDWGGCRVLEPLALETPEAVWGAIAALTPDIAGIDRVLQRALAAVDAATECPALEQTTTSDGDAQWEMSGDCVTTLGARFSGTARVTVLGHGAPSMATLTELEAFSFELPGAPAPLRFTGAGTLLVDDRYSDDDGAEVAVRIVTAELRYALAHDGSIDARAGTFEHAVRLVRDGDEAWRVVDAGYTRIGGEGAGPRGDWCVWAEVASGTCDSEGDGVIRIAGDREAVLTMDGSTSCDGCGQLLLGSMDLGTVCP